MKLYAKTNKGSYLNNYKGEPWSEVKEVLHQYPSGNVKCFKFPSGFICKQKDCKVCYVFEKNS